MKFKIQNSKLKINDGYLLIEAIIALTLLTVGFLGILGLIANSISLNRVVGDRFIANYLSMEGIEIVKNIIDGNVLRGRPFNEGFDTGNFEVDYQSADLEPDAGRRLLFDTPSNRYGYLVGQETPFVRTVKIELKTDEIKVNSVVKWKGRGGANFETNLEDHFFNWRP